jgi:hypothetical protein
VQQTGIDLVVLNKRVPQPAETPSPSRETLWRPFFFERSRLVSARQRGHLRDRELPPAELEIRIRALSRALGKPVFEDASIAVFRAGGPRRAPPQ